MVTGKRFFLQINKTRGWRWLKGSRTDRVLLILMLLGVIASWQWLSYHLAGGSPMVFIYRDQTLLAKYSLQPEHDVRFTVKGAIGTSTIRITKQGVRISESPCTTQYCVRSGVHRHYGDVLACVPNHIMVSIRGDERQSMDAVTE